jgi:hypothetical protein
VGQRNDQGEPLRTAERMIPGHFDIEIVYHWINRHHKLSERKNSIN